jgi:hypothetical protein
VNLYSACIKLRDVEQSGKQTVHRGRRFLDLFNQPLPFQRNDEAAQSTNK